MHPERIDTRTAESRLRFELLRTYEEYCQLLLAVRDYLATTYSMPVIGKSNKSRFMD